jgi:MFS family permease
VPILLSVSPAPVFERTRRMSPRALYRASPLGCVGSFFLGGMFACMFGMASVYGSRAGLTNLEISVFIGALYVGGLALQYPIGWVSDRMDRRLLILIVTAASAGACVVAVLWGTASFPVLVAAAFLIGGTANPLYSLLVAYTNDYLEPEDMASAAAGLIVLNGIGAAGTPILVGYAMDLMGPPAFPAFMGVLMGAISLYALFRMTVRPATPVDETLPVAPMGMYGSPVAGTAAQEAVIEQVAAEAEAEAEAEAQAAAHAATWADGAADDPGGEDGPEGGARREPA